MSTLADTAAREKIVTRLADLRSDTVPLWGRMKAPEMICHLNDSFLTSFGEREVSSASGLFQRTAMKWVALYLPMRWPKSLPTLPEVEQGLGGTCPKDFSDDRAALIRTINRFSAPDPAVGRFPHPIFGSMPPAQWLRWGYLHANHHLRQFGV